MKQFNLLDFLRKFYGITNPTLKLNTLTHDDVKKIFPFIRTCPLEDVSMEDVYHGDLVGVYDKNNIIIYYYNPRIDINYYEDIVYEKEIKEDINIDEIAFLSKDELLKLRRKYRLLGLKSSVNKLTKLIHKKKQDEPKLYREKKEKLKIKENYYD